MEQSFRIALCMYLLTGYLLIGYLQATPVSKCYRTDDLRFGLLRGSCKNVTLTAPTNVKETCRSAAMKCFMKELERARDKCEGDKERFNDTLDALKEGNECYRLTEANSSECNWEAETYSKQFDEFLTATEAFIQELNTKRNQ